MKLINILALLLSFTFTTSTHGATLTNKTKQTANNKKKRQRRLRDIIKRLKISRSPACSSDDYYQITKDIFDNKQCQELILENPSAVFDFENEATPFHTVIYKGPIKMVALYLTHPFCSENLSMETIRLAISLIKTKLKSLREFGVNQQQFQNYIKDHQNILRMLQDAYRKRYCAMLSSFCTIL